MNPTRHFFCPACDDTIVAPLDAVRVTCPGCHASFEVDNDAECVDGQWRDCSALHSVEDKP